MVTDPEPEPEPEVNPESRLRHDLYINARFVDIFRHEDGDDSFAGMVEKGLSANDHRPSAAPARAERGSRFPIFMAWFRAGKEKK